MTTIAILVAIVALGVDSGYEPAADGGLEYIVQIEPQLVAPLVKGQDITSELPRGLAVRHFRVTIGTGKLPKQDATSGTTRNRFPTDAMDPRRSRASRRRMSAWVTTHWAIRTANTWSKSLPQV